MMIIKKILFQLTTFILPLLLHAQDLSEGLQVNDLELHPMQEIDKPAYLESYVDPSFGTTIRRITNAGTGEVIVPMYSTVQAWNTDETLMILYNQATGIHELIDGMDYQFIRTLEDVNPADLEQIFWDFTDPDIFYYLESQSNDFIKYSVSSHEKIIVVNLVDLLSCSSGINMGNDIQMMSWDSDVFTFRCANESAYSYRISTEEITEFTIDELNYAAPGVAPSGNRYYHRTKVYNELGTEEIDLNIYSVEHSCIGRLDNGNDAYYAIAFAEGPEGGCIGDIIAHDLVSGECIPVISQGQGYDYPQSGTHISALAHKNTEGGWIAASMIGYDKDGQELLDQELVIAKIEGEETKVCRIGHHRSDEDEFDYWGEPHAVISPTGTRVLFASDWSGPEDGESIDSYVVELPTFSVSTASSETPLTSRKHKIFPNPVNDFLTIDFDNEDGRRRTIIVYDMEGRNLIEQESYSHSFKLDTRNISSGIYYYIIIDEDGHRSLGKFVRK